MSGAFAAEAHRASTVPSPPAPAIERFLPLSEEDKARSHQTGCNFVFGGVRTDYLQLIGDELMFRTGSGLHTCSIVNADAFLDEKHVAVCDGVSLRYRRTGRTTAYPASDSSTGPARLTIRQGRASRVVRGHWGVAC